MVLTFTSELQRLLTGINDPPLHVVADPGRAVASGAIGTVSAIGRAALPLVTGSSNATRTELHVSVEHLDFGDSLAGLLVDGVEATPYVGATLRLSHTGVEVEIPYLPGFEVDQFAHVDDWFRRMKPQENLRTSYARRRRHALWVPLGRAFGGGGFADR